MNNLIKIMAQAAAPPGCLSFARFMELALYCPNFGYYERPDVSPGRRGDFFTSVSVGPLFGEMLAFQFARWLTPLPARPRQLVEAGAHDGRLARDILASLNHRQPALWDSLEYWILEPSANRQREQQMNLAEFAPKVRWFESWDTVSSSGIHGVIFSNELLDALPVHRLGWDAARREWFEWGVRIENNTLAWIRLPAASGAQSLAPSRNRPVKEVDRPLPQERERLPPALVGTPDGGRSFEPQMLLPLPGGEGRGEGGHFSIASTGPGVPPGFALPKLPPELAAVLPDAFTTEICPAATEWWRQAARHLRSGRLLAIDYGLTAEEFLAPGRARGTLRAFYQHHASADLLARPGEQDLTAHVNFTALEHAGAGEGLVTEPLQSQAQFLTSILQQLESDHETPGDWTPKQARQFQTLTHPEHLGRAFKVLVQSRA